MPISLSPAWRYWAPPILWTLAILSLSGDLGASRRSSGLLTWFLSWIVTLSPEGLEVLHGYVRKAAHVLTYGFLAVLWFRALTSRFSGRPGINVILTLALCLMVALLDEGHQALVASRRGSLGDVALDMAGAALLVGLAALIWKQRPAPPPGIGPPLP